MKKLLPVLLILNSIVLANITGAQNGMDTETRFLDAFLNQWHRDAAVANMDGYLGAMADEGLFIGTDSSLVLQLIFDRFGMNGTMVMLDPRTNRYYGYHPARWDSGYLPASTFKIPNTLIGLETGVIDTGYIFLWNGERRRMPEWNQDLVLRDAFRLSCVPCYQEVARKLGPETMNEYLALLNYGHMDVHPDNIDVFWLEGESGITPRQQVDFLRRLQEETLPVRVSSMKAVKSIMLNEETPEFRLYGKTGWAIREGNNYGWFVGWVETNGQLLYIATLIEPVTRERITDFATARKTVTMEVLRTLGVIGTSPKHSQVSPGSLTGLLNRLTGTWTMETTHGSLYESWSRETDILFRGLSFQVTAEDTAILEQITIERRPSGWYYIPVVSGQNEGEPVFFKLTSTLNDTLVFENPDHDFPQRITYSFPAADSLTASISGSDQGTIRSEVFRMTRVNK